MLTNIAILKKYTNKELTPLLIKGKVIPLVGNNPMVTEILKRDCKANSDVMPKARSFLK